MHKIALGTYRISDQNPEHIEAIRMAVTSGVRLIDTSTNYMDGGAERAIAKALRFMEDAARESVEIVSKYGYLQGSTLQRVKEGERFSQIVEYAPHVFHCIHPDFMRDQLERSLQRLGCASIGCYLIHNPEYFLLDALGKGLERAAALDEMNARIYKAFEGLEQAVGEGKIDGYGISSNSFAKAANDPEFLPYEDLPALASHAAAAVGNDRHHFTTVQLPINLLEQEGLKCAAWAKAHALRVLANRPLNAQYGGRMYRLADYAPPPEYDSRLNELLELCNSEALKALQTLVTQLDDVKHRFSWVGDYESFLYSQALPHVKQVLAALEPQAAEALAQQVVLFFESYEKTVAHECSLRLRSELRDVLPECRGTLQQCALHFLLERPEIDFVLLGMRKPRYVAEVMHAEMP